MQAVHVSNDPPDDKAQSGHGHEQDHGHGHAHGAADGPASGHSDGPASGGEEPASGAPAVLAKHSAAIGTVAVSESRALSLEKKHSAAIGTVAVSEARPLSLEKFNLWLGEMLWEGGAGGEDIFRMKGVLLIKDDPRRFVLQCLTRGDSQAIPK
ncbi:hypothetical protein T484DRAFT_1803028 [Baffinella frigidus]|nr:hypothetical protein T484DRAFT_1803028 [Cryptophyta sp. CCMP2293]